MAKRLGVHRRLTVLERRAAVLGIGARAFAAGVLRRGRWRARRDGVPLVFARRRQPRLRSVDQRLDFSFRILVQHAAPLSEIRVSRSSVDRERLTVAGRDTLLRVVSSVRTIARTSRTTFVRTERPSDPGARVSSNVGMMQERVATHSLSTRVSHSLVQRTSNRMLAIRSVGGRNLAPRVDPAAPRAAMALPGQHPSSANGSSRVWNRWQTTLITRPTPPSLAPPLPGRRAAARLLPETERPRFLPAHSPTAATTAPEPRTAGRTLLRVAPTYLSRTSASPAESARPPVVRPLIALIGRSRLAPLVTLRPRLTEFAADAARRPTLSPPVRVRLAQTPLDAFDRPVSSFAAPTPSLIHVRPRSADAATAMHLTEGVIRTAQTTAADPGTGAPARATFTLASAKPQELQALSHRVYDLIVDRVRREKERLGR